MSDNLKASLFMVAAMAAFAMQDVFIKLLSVDLPSGQVIFAIGAGGLAAQAVFAATRRVPLVTRGLLAPSIMLRNLFEFGASITLVTALALVPLSVVSAIMQAAPLIVTAGAAIFFHERVGWRRWTAIGAGLIGVMIILRPGVEGFEPAALLAIGGTVMLGLRDIVTRAIPREVASLQVAAWAFASITLAGLLMLAFGPAPVVPDARQWVQIAIMVGLGVLAFSALVLSTRIGEMAVVAPFRYSRIVFALVLSIVVFGERLDAASLLGIALVVGSGLYTLLREARMKRRGRASPPSVVTPPGL